MKYLILFFVLWVIFFSALIIGCSSNTSEPKEVTGSLKKESEIKILHQGWFRHREYYIVELPTKDTMIIFYKSYNGDMKIEKLNK